MAKQMTERAQTDTVVDPDDGDPAADAVVPRLRLAVARLARLLRQNAETGLSPSQMSALVAIERHGPLPLGELAAHEGVAPPTVTRVVARLEEEDRVTRTVDPEDRRVARVEITENGRDLLAHSRNRKEAWLDARVDALDPADQALLAEALPVLEHLTRMTNDVSRDPT